MDKNQREERRRQEDIALNRGLLWVGAAILMELLLMLVNKYYINYYSTVESINMVYAFDAGLKAVRIVALIALAGREVRVLPAEAGYSLIFLTLAVNVVAVAAAAVMGGNVGYYLIYVLVAWLFALLVYYTVKMM